MKHKDNPEKYIRLRTALHVGLSIFRYKMLYNVRDAIYQPLIQLIELADTPAKVAASTDALKYGRTSIPFSCADSALSIFAINGFGIPAGTLAPADSLAKNERGF